MKDKNPSNKTKILIAIAILFILFVLITGVAIAYFTSRPATITNTFTVGNVSIETTETNWNASNATAVRPGDTISKDPKITNIGNVPVYAFLIVEVPKVSGMRYNSQNHGSVSNYNGLMFTYTLNSGWVQVEDESTAQKGVYVYGYTSVLNPNSTTTTLFDSITYINAVEGQISSSTAQQVLVTGVAIQSDQLRIDGEDLTMAEKLTYVYRDYLS